VCVCMCVHVVCAYVFVRSYLYACMRMHVCLCKRLYMHIDNVKYTCTGHILHTCECWHILCRETVFITQSYRLKFGEYEHAESEQNCSKRY